MALDKIVLFWGFFNQKIQNQNVCCGYSMELSQLVDSNEFGSIYMGKQKKNLYRYASYLEQYVTEQQINFWAFGYITKTRLFKYIENFASKS